MAQATAQFPVAFYAPPSKPRALYDSRFGSINSIRKFGQGAATSLLAFTGVGNMTGSVSSGAAPTVSDFTTLDGLTQAVLEGRLTGPAQLIAGAFLFIAAGRCTARLVGLAAGASLIYLYTQGHTPADGLQIARDLAVRFGAAISAFRSAGGAAAAI